MAQKYRALPLPLAEKYIGDSDYFDAVVGNLARGWKFKPESRVFRLSSGGIYEVWDDIEIVVPYVTMTNKGPKLHASVWTSEAGDALRPRLRDATEAELLCIGTRRELSVPHNFVSVGQRVMVRILEHHEDAMSVWRQLAKHIPANYLGRRYDIQKETVIIPGKIDSIRLMLDLLIEARQDLADRIGNVGEERRQSVKSMAEMVVTELERKQTFPQISARQALTELGVAESDEVMLDCIFKAEGALKAEELQAAVITEVELDRATTLVKMLHRIQDGTDHAFIALGKLCQDVFRLKEMLMRDAITVQEAFYKIVKLGQRARNLYARFLRVCVFKPWHEPVSSERGLGLFHAANCLMRCSQGASKLDQLTTLNAALRFLSNALSAYEKLVEGEDPHKGEITNIKKWRASVVGKFTA